MRKLVLVAVVLAVFIPGTAQAGDQAIAATLDLKEATVFVPTQTLDNGSYGTTRAQLRTMYEDGSVSQHELEFYWDGALNDSSGQRIWTGEIIYEGAAPYRQRGLRRARLTFTTTDCIWVQEEGVPGADADGCIEGTLAINARWAGFGPISSTTGDAALTETRQATITGGFTFDGQRLPGSRFSLGTGELRRSSTT